MRCEGIIRIPIAIRGNSLISCPHCSTQFKLAEFADQIPQGEIVESENLNGTASDSGEFQIDTDGIAQQDGKFVVPPQLAAGIRKRRRRRRKRSSESSSSDTNTPKQLSEAEELRTARKEERAQREREKIQAGVSAAVVANPNVRSRSQRKSSAPKRSPVFEAVKIIFGGLLAAPIAYLLLMWVFSRDPLNLVPTINSYAPILVPEALTFEGDESTKPLVDPDGIPEDSLRGLPVPETDPDDIDPLQVDLGL